MTKHFQVNQLMQFVNNSFFDGKLDPNDSQAWKSVVAKETRKKTLFGSAKRGTILESE